MAKSTLLLFFLAHSKCVSTTINTILLHESF
ncbi:unnamed protein product [Spirodela intermedia]|uniref:Uncharacterized protein n=1 Tax=Spirodela intermedia TaxID=51605 RepID=A0A7I8L940_SPIIN|nr:unnamed protein product [Spirodela intermedia]